MRIRFHYDKMRLQRVRKGISLAGLASISGASAQTLSRYERGEVEHPSLIVVRKVEVALRLRKGLLFT